jgi:hypothetical protein
MALKILSMILLMSHSSELLARAWKSAGSKPLAFVADY